MMIAINYKLWITCAVSDQWNHVDRCVRERDSNQAFLSLWCDVIIHLVFGEIFRFSAINFMFLIDSIYLIHVYVSFFFLAAKAKEKK